MRAVIALGVGGLALAIGCGGPSPSQAPLSPPTGEPRPKRPSSSRFSGTEDTTSADKGPDSGVTIEVDSDDDGFDRVSSSTAGRGACVPAAASRPDCSRIAAAGKGACSGSVAMRACETWGPVLDGTVVERWLSCLTARAGAAACDGNQAMSCALRAIESACVDGSFRARCERIAAACSDSVPELTRGACEKALAAFAPAKKEQIARCFEHGCETGAFGSCIP